MKQIKAGLCVLVFCFLLQGCATVKGVQQDVKSAVYHTTNPQGALPQTDRWLQEHAW